MISEIDRIASSIRFHLQIRDVNPAEIHNFAHRILKLANLGYGQEPLKHEIFRLEINGMQQPLDLVICGRIATLALGVVAGLAA